MDRRKWMWIATVALVLALPQTLAASGIPGEIEIEGPEGEPIFGYGGSRGPMFWAGIDPAWELCGTGLEQSPIDLKALDAQLENLADVEFDYHDSPVTFVNNGHTIQMNYEEGSSITVDGEEYELLQFHFHTPSEHTLQGGAQFPLEVHLVHQGAGGLAVVGVFVTEGLFHHAGLPYARRLRQYLPSAPGVLVEFHDEQLNATTFLPQDRRSYRYDGSLTTPPCSEGVKWIVMSEPIALARGQLRTIRNALNQLEFASGQGANNRPTQPLDGRTVDYDTDAE